jgi:hypothetical protein
MFDRLAVLGVTFAVLAAACAAESSGAGTPPPRPTLPSTLTAGEAGAHLEVPGQQPLVLEKRTVELGDVVFDTFNGGSVPLDRATPTMIARLSDAIPPLDTPRYEEAAAGDWMAPTDLVLGYIAADGVAYAYPHKILNFHEIVNDVLAEQPIVITFCPLCRSSVVYDRRLDGETLTFGNTSALYLSDMVMFDRETYSYWWQVPGEAIVGTFAGQRLTPLASETVEWRTWRALHPDTQLLSRETGFARNYDRDPFTSLGASLDEGARPFQSSPAETDGRLAPSEVVLGLEVDGRHAVYSLTRIGDGVRNGDLAERPVVVFSSAAGPGGAAFFADPTIDEDLEVDLDEDEVLTFESGGGVWRDDQTGSIWDFAGRAIEGPLTGTQLERAPSRVTFWYAFVAAFPEAELRD